MEPIFQLPIVVPPRHSRNRLRALHRQLRAAILEGRLQPGVRLPPTRAFAAAYGVSRNVAVATYDLLLSEGYLSTRRGAGTYVADALPKVPERKTAASRSAAHDRRLNAFWRQPPAGSDDLHRSAPRFDFCVGVPDIRQFPFDAWRRMSNRALRAFAKKPALYGSPLGQLALREAIAKHVSFTRAVACRAEDVIVTTGAQQVFDLLARILVTPGRTVVAMENPGYPSPRAAFLAAGGKVVPTPVDDEGLVVAKIPASARIVCVTPSHQSPLGPVMSAHRRAALLEFAQAHGAVVIEDDYDGEFHFGGRPVDALQTLDRSDSVFYVGTFSKSLFPAVRIGFVVAPRWAQQSLATAKRYADSHCSVLAQETLAAFIAEGHLARHVRRMRQVYASRQQALLDGLQKDFERWLEPVPCGAGLHLAAFARGSLDVESLVEKALQREVGLHSLRRYQFGRAGRPGLVFGYGTLDEAGIYEGLARLRRVCSE
ncbi:MAG TPA: PLP-dependent aminotransferase family protein [Povalibacter sp.]|nr:PLP-dependent aminotransferase family protein [Povalibacter sp.]